jgi:hypothetical protein
MSKGYRNGAFALGLVVGGGLALNLFLWLDYKAKYEGDQPTNSNGGTQSSEIGSYWDMLIGTFISPSDTLAQWIMAIFTIAVVVLVYRTLVATQDMARDTRDIGQKQARAYLSIMLGKAEIEVVGNKDGSNLVVKIAVSVMNSGNTPGYSPIIYYDIQEAAPNDVIPIPDPENMQCSHINNSFIAANGTSKTQLSRVFTVDDPIAFQRFKDRLIRFSYCINYLDEFSKDRWSPIISGTFHHWPEGSISFISDKIHGTKEG